MISLRGPKLKILAAVLAVIGHRIEDRQRRVLYEAKMTKFTLTSPYGFDFIDHEHGRTMPHLVGHEEVSEYNSFLLDSNYSVCWNKELSE